jgi:hypothetical protein
VRQSRLPLWCNNLPLAVRDVSDSNSVTLNLPPLAHAARDRRRDPAGRDSHARLSQCRAARPASNSALPVPVGRRRQRVSESLSNSEIISDRVTSGCHTDGDRRIIIPAAASPSHWHLSESRF